MAWYAASFAAWQDHLVLGAYRAWQDDLLLNTSV